MTMLRFSDGININTDGPYRMIRERDGLYITGHGFLCPVDTIEQANDILEELKANEKDDA